MKPRYRIVSDRFIIENDAKDHRKIKCFELVDGKTVPVAGLAAYRLKVSKAPLDYGKTGFSIDECKPASCTLHVKIIPPGTGFFDTPEEPRIEQSRIVTARFENDNFLIELGGDQSKLYQRSRQHNLADFRNTEITQIFEFDISWNPDRDFMPRLIVSAHLW